MSLKTASDLKEGETGMILSYGNDRIAGKLLSMGFIPGKTLRLVRKSPFGGGLYLKMEENVIAVRENEASYILISDTQV